ncbi:MAG: phosphoglycerate kinase, partial [Patescibacteria group bacterium]
MILPCLENAKIEGKTVLLRVDLDVPIEKSKILDDSRLEASVPTIEYLLKQNCKVIVCGHLGRPDSVFSNQDSAFSLKPVAKWFARKFDSQIKETALGGFDGWEISENLFLLENLRFFKEEEDPSTSSGQEFARKLADLAQIYVNDAFASSHRAHASIVGVSKLLPHFAGLHLQKEVETLSRVLENPRRPLTVVIGGAKIETKLPMVSKMHGFADYVLVGGEIAEHTRELLKVEHEKTERKSELLIADLTPDQKDINEESIQKFIDVINKSSTILWNGPLGLVEDCFDLGTREVAQAIAKSSGNTIVGGGDTVSFLKKEGLLQLSLELTSSEG